MRALAVLLAAAGCTAAAAQEGRWINEGRGEPLRPGVYGRIAVNGTAPPVINSKPVMVSRATRDQLSDPLYLYVPPGQVRRWSQHCAKWDACGRPVYFVRMDDSPSRLGDWKRSQRGQVEESRVQQALNRFIGP